MLTNVKIWVDERYRQCFPVSELKGNRGEHGPSFPDATVVRTESHKQIIYVQRRCCHGRLGFYIKMQRPKRLLKQIVRNRLRPISKARRELGLIRMYRSLGFRVPEAVAMVEERFLWIPIRGLIIQKEVKGREFPELLRTSSDRARRRFLRAYGKLVGQLHSAGLISSLARVTDIICTRDIDATWQEIELTIIDREHGPLMTEAYEMELVCSKLTALLNKYNVYVKSPNHREAIAFLSGYMGALTVSERPAKKSIYETVRSRYTQSVHKELRETDVTQPATSC